MVGESLITRLARERLAAIKKFIPLRDSVRQQLQQRQAAQADFSTDIQQLFSPVTTATTAVKSAITAQPNILPTLQQIASTGEKTQRRIEQLSGELQTQQEIQRLGNIDIPQPAIANVQPAQQAQPAIEFDPTEPYVELAGEKSSSVENIFLSTTLDKIRNEITSDKELAKFAKNNFPADIRRNLINPDQDKYVSGTVIWAKKSIFSAPRWRSNFR